MKNIITLLIILLITAYLINSCGSVSESSRSNPISIPDDSGQWLIPINEVYDGGPGRDGIPSLQNPEFIDAASASSFMSDNDLVLGLKVGNQARAYPHPILNWHEIINDTFSGVVIAVTYCPLTGSGIGWNRLIGDNVTTFGVSGLLYNTNVIPYDRNTNSNWSQMRNRCVNGQLLGEFPEIIQIVETTWQTWKAMYPSTRIVSTNTGFSRSYTTYPYGDYRTNNRRLIFPVEPEDGRLPFKTRVLGVAAEGLRVAYPINNFSNEIETINQTYGSIQAVVIGSRLLNFAVAFNRKIGNTTLEFSPLQNQLPIIMIDNEGTSWDVFGNGISGPRTGSKLEPVQNYISYWVAWAGFNSTTTIYSQ
jgi:hypothetical protein